MQSANFQPSMQQQQQVNPHVLQQPGEAFAGARWERKYLDFHSSTIKFVKQDALNDVPVYQRGGLRNFPEYAKHVRPIIGSRDLSSDMSGICSKFVHAAVNKNRCAVNCLEWLNNGRRLLTGNHMGEFTLWNATTFSFENMLQAHPCPVRCFHWMPDGSTLLSGDAIGGIKFWDSNFYPFVNFQAHKEPIRDLTSSPNGSKFATCADESSAKIWDFRTGQEERLLKGHGWDVKSCQWHNSKALLATGSKDCSIKLWDPRASEAIATIFCHKSVVTRVRWSPDGQWLASGSKDQIVKVMDIRKMAITDDHVFKTHSKEITALAWHPLDPSVLTSGSYDGQICWWDVNNTNTGQPMETLIGAHEAAVWAISYHPIGNLMATGSHDNATKFWGRTKPGDGNPQELLPKGKAYLTHMQQVQQLQQQRPAA